MIRSLLINSRDTLLQVNWTLLALRTLNLIYTAVQTGTWVSKKTYTALTDAFSEEVYVFFKGDSTPYHVRHVNQDGPGIASVVWTYNRHTKSFTSSSAGSHTHSKHLEWLSASIQYNGLNLYSLDDVIEGTKYLDANGVMPSSDILVAAWSLSSGIVLDKTIDLKLFIIHSDGREETISLWSQFQKKEEKQSTKLVNEYRFPSTTMDVPAPLLHTFMVNERFMRESDIQELRKEVEEKKVGDVSGNSEIPLTNGIPEVDFEKVD